MPITGQSANTNQLNLSANSVATINQDLMKLTKEVNIGAINLTGNSSAISANGNSNAGSTIIFSTNSSNNFALSKNPLENALKNIDISNDSPVLQIGNFTVREENILGSDNNKLNSIKILSNCNITFKETAHINSSIVIEAAPNASFNFENRKFSFLNDTNSNIIISSIDEIFDINCRGSDIPGDILNHFEFHDLV